jgi:hypothetical protein
MAGQVTHSLNRLIQAQMLRVQQQPQQQSQQQKSVVGQCTLSASVEPLTDDDGNAEPVDEQQLLQAWAYLLFWFAVFSTHLPLHSVELSGLQAAELASAAEALPLDLENWQEVVERVQFQHFQPALQQGDSSVLGALLADAFPDLTTLELRGCDIAPSQLAPLLSTAPIKALKLTEGTQLGTSSGDSIQALLSLLSQTRISHLEVGRSLWGPPSADASQPRQPVPPSIQDRAVGHLRYLRSVKLEGCGALDGLVPLLNLMPSLTHLDVQAGGGGCAPEPVNTPLRQLFGRMPHLKTLLLPLTNYHGALPSALLESKHLEVLQVNNALRGVGVGREWGRLIWALRSLKR